MLAPSATQIVYVNKGGNDGYNGAIDRPFLTIQGALSSIKDASAAKRYEISVGPGIYADAFQVKPWIGIVGVNAGENGVTPNGEMQTEITAPANTIGFDASWATSGFSDAWLSALGFQNAQLFSEVAGSQPQLNFKACAFNNLITFIGPGTAGVDNVLLQDCLFYGGITCAGWQFLWTRACAFLGGTVTVETPLTAIENTTWLAQNCSVGAGFAATNVSLVAPSGASKFARADLSNTAVVGAVTLNGTNTGFAATAEGIPPSVSLLAGAPLPTLSGGLGYVPGSPSNWAPPSPAQQSSAIDRLASAVKGLLGGPIP